MVRASSKIAENEESSKSNVETEERKRLKNLAFSRKLLSHTPAKPITTLNPSKTIVKHQGRDIVKRGHRKNKFLLSFPGLFAPISGGKIGEWTDLGTKNPILYLDFPQGQVKLFGTFVYPKNKYLTLQFARGGKNVMSEDIFDNMIVFSEAWWIGTREENPEEVRLEFPQELSEGNTADCDFKGGAGATSGERSTTNKSKKEYVEPLSPETELKDDVSEDSSPLTGKNLNNETEVTPARHSARTVGKTFNYAESFSGDDSVGSDSDISEQKKEKVDDPPRSPMLGKTEDSNLPVSGPHDTEIVNVEVRTRSPGKRQQSSQSAKKLKEISHNKRGALVQATISTLFEKVEEKKSTRDLKKSPTPKGSGQRKKHIDSKQTSNQVKAEEPSKKRMHTKGKKAGTVSVKKLKHSQDNNVSDEDWTA